MPQRRALIVAIDAYPPPNALPSCLNDGRAIEALLLAAGYTGRTLYDGQATVANVSAGLDWLMAGAQAGDDLLFYYSGHGYSPTVAGTPRQCLVLFDGPLFDSEFTPRSAPLPPGTLTVILDACFSGGFDKFLVCAVDGTPVVEATKGKSFVPTPGELQRLGIPSGAPLAMPIPGIQFFGKSTPVAAEKAAQEIVHSAASVNKGDGISLPKGSTDLNGLLIAACMETETASASTSATAGKSAFTYGLLTTIDKLGTKQSNRAIFEAAAAKLLALGFKQTPVLRESELPGDLAERCFLTLDPIGGGLPGAPLAPGTAATAMNVDALAAVLGALLPAIVQAAPKSTAPDWTAPPGPAAKSAEQIAIEIAVAVLGRLISSR